MKFIVDAQLPYKLAAWLNQCGHDAIHTLDLPDKNATSDAVINAISVAEKRILISKDADFFDRYFRKLEPHKLIFLTTGNISTSKLLELFEKNIDRIIEEITLNNVIEITPKNIVTID